ncbi:MAG: NAD(P)-dependent oxidoreductase [Roseibium album]|uniref:2-hydroxy-3-oxopropionate reductase n=1 Tax=Roseibium album TaxID=311410 RepID=A0A0M7A877_9HYPH|nr:NAD(P)-dependent oxidoreductase [Roseibium album]CTQ63407.1 2-hydroxy-3-oxopropionate reductase [Roseibium album]CTQ69824.1 2-hydroxy-3-oxopropionate reductase [Roseibium album]CTQ80994.1 2-hydroxy-3-oxopropionate reductase [Roseibium album]
MLRAGVIGLGDMGSGLAKNLIKNGFETSGFDLSEERLAAFTALGGRAARSVADVAANADVVYVMVMNGNQAKAVILGDDGLAANMTDGGTIILTATIKPSEARQIGEELNGGLINLIDCPVSGGFPGAQGGTLTMMAAGTPDVLEKARPVMEAVSQTIHVVGERPGEGQTVKSCLQSLIGSIFSATFEAAALAAKAGVAGEVIYNVFSTSGAGCGVSRTALENIIDRKFEGTGSHIATMHKDLTIALDLAQGLEVPMQTASTAMQIFHAGKSRYPNGDNWVCTRVIEEIVGAELHR